MTDLLTRTLPVAPDTPTVVPATPLTGTVAEDLVVLVAPSTGRFRPLDRVTVVEPGQLLGHVTGGGGRADEIRSPVRAVLRDLLVRPGQLVARGQALVWLCRS